MATAQKVMNRRSIPLPRSRRLRRVLVLLALAGVFALAWFWGPLKAQSLTAASYAARVACPCRFIAGRDLSSCRDDFVPGMGLVLLSDDEEGRSVTARVPLLSAQTATFREGQGCVLERWSN